MRPYLLIENNWKNLSTDRHDLAVMSWGATEAHNYHLPYGTDVYEADAISTESARKAHEKGGKVIVLPPIPFGVNTGQRDIYLDINLNPSTQLVIMRDILTVLNRQGVKKLLLINAHGGNDFKPGLRELGVEFPEMLLTLCNFFQVLDKKSYFEEEGDHADEMMRIRKTELATDQHGGEREASEIKYLRPELLKLERSPDESGENLNSLKLPSTLYTAIWWYASYPNHYAGDASFASVKLGKLITDNTLNELITAIKSVKNDRQTLEIQREYFKNVKQ